MNKTFARRMGLYADIASGNQNKNMFAPAEVLSHQNRNKFKY